MKTVMNARMAQINTGIAGLMRVELDMSEAQMFEALNQFLHHVTDETWTKWQQKINLEIYGEVAQ